MKKRLDQLVYENLNIQSREKAKALVVDGHIYVNGKMVDKPGEKVAEDVQIELKDADMRYVSRGGYKLEKAIAEFNVNLQNKICMDIGASTGGFTDCMLQNAAGKVYSVDAGYGQLAQKLRVNKKVINMERCNFRYLQPADVPEQIDFFSVDVSFISLKFIFPVMNILSVRFAEAICLIKPQFEAGKEKIGKKGVVKDLKTHVEVIETVCSYAVQNGFSIEKLSFSPIKGPEGNIEFLICVKKSEQPQNINNEKIFEIAQNAHKALADK